jgi:hypothetical protein
VKGPRAAVLVQLSDRHVRNHTGDGDLDARVFQRQPIDRRISTLDEEEGRKCPVSR